MFTVPTRGRALDAEGLLDHKLTTPERAGGRHRSPHGGDGGTEDPFVTSDPWKANQVQLSPAILEAKHRLIAMRASLSEVPKFPGNEVGQPSNADLMAKLNRMMGAMALKENVQIAQMEVIKQMRSEISSQIEPLRAQVATTIESASQALEKTTSLNARLTPVENTVTQLSSGQATLFERVGQIESQKL